MPYIGTSPSNGVRRVHTYTATASQTTFTGASSEGITLSYADTNYLDVFQNGVLLGSADYTSTSGTSVVLAQGASADDLIVIVVYDVFSVADTVSKANGGSFDSAVTMSGGISGNTSISGDLTIPDKIIHDGDTNTAIRFPSADTVTIETGGSERARVDSSGNFLVGTTDTTPYNNNAGTSSDRGFVVTDGRIFSATNSNSVSILNRTDSDGDIVQFRKDGTAVGSIGSISGSYVYIGEPSAVGISFIADRVRPTTDGANADNTYDFGHPTVRWDDIYATNGTIQTSDKNEKQDIEELSDAEKRVAVVAKGLMRKFRWKDAVAKKSDKARTHFGIIAQDLEDAFKAEGLDASKYAMFCSDTWWEKEISVDAVEADEEKDIEAKDAYTYIDIKEEETKGYTKKTRLGVRYSELLAFIISAI